MVALDRAVTNRLYSSSEPTVHDTPSPGPFCQTLAWSWVASSTLAPLVKVPALR